VVIPAPTTPRQELAAHAAAKLRVQLVLRQRPPTREGPLDRLGDLSKSVARGYLLFPQEPPPQRGPELLGELLLVVGDQRGAVEREVAPRERVDRRPQARRDDQLIRVDRTLLRLARHSVGPGGERHRRRAARVVRDRARGSLEERH
jgi:hypothetical protein